MAPPAAPGPSRQRLTAARCKHCLRVFVARLFSHVGLCALVVGYAVIGAVTFEALEASHEIDKRKVNAFKRDRCLAEMWDITERLNVLYQPNWTAEVGERLRQFEQEVISAVKNDGYDGKDAHDHVKQWSFSGALLYSVTVITTIGYGNISPKTDQGKVVTILYALLGIPLMLLCLTNIGNFFAQAFKFAYGRLCCVVCRERQHSRGSRAGAVVSGSIKYVQTPAPSPSRERKMPITLPVVDVTTVDVSETESCHSGLQQNNRGKPMTPNNGPVTLEIPSEDNIVVETQTAEAEPMTNGDSARYETQRVPISLVLGLVTGYICIGAVIFAEWERWSFLDGSYFCFITLSTIGFGDLVPGTSILSADTQAGQAKLIICCFYLVLGLAIIAMAFNLVQEEVIQRCTDIGHNLGIISYDDDDDDE